MEPPVHIRQAVPADVRKLSVLYMQVYIQTYGVEGVSDEFANFITRQFGIPRLEALLADEPDALLVAEFKGNLVGVLEMDWNKTCPVGGFTAPELNKIYILEWFCGQGIGDQLIRTAEDLLRERGEEQVWLWLLETNARALAFYRKHGYEVIGKAPFEMETNTYTNLVMRKRL